MITVIRQFFLTMLLCLIGCASANAQSRISSVYGVNLGDSESVVASKISGSWNTSKNGERYYKVNKPKLGNCSFNQANFWFKGNKLYKVVFVSSTSYPLDTYIPGNAYSNPMYDRFVRESSETYRSIFEEMRFNLTDKYGSPRISDSNKAQWSSNGNQIEISYDFSPSTRFTSVRVEYSVKGGSNSNF